MSIFVAIEEFSDGYDQPRQVIPVHSAWIDPDGNFYALAPCGHSNFAYRYHEVWEDTLEDRGWMHISYGRVLRHRSPRQCQINTLFELMYAYQRAIKEQNVSYRDGDARMAESFEVTMRDLIAECNEGMDW